MIYKCSPFFSVLAILVSEYICGYIVKKHQGVVECLRNCHESGHIILYKIFLGGAAHGETSATNIRISLRSVFSNIMKQ